jgi:hypothetical protein
MTIKKIGAAAAVMLGFAGPAVAGPEMTFGPDGKGSLQLDYKGQLHMTVRDIGSGPNNDDTTTNFNMRRNRLALMGSYGDNMGLYVQTEFADQTSLNPLGVNTTTTSPQFSVLDAVFRFQLSDAVIINAGKFKYAFSRENLEACEMPLTLDRSLFITAPLLTSNPTRDVGVSVWGNLFNEVFQYRFDVMDGRKAAAGDASTPAAPKSSFRYSSRMHVSLLEPESNYGYRGTYLGQKKVLTFGAAVQLEPDAVYSDWIAKTDAKDYFAWTVDGYFEYPIKDVGTFTVSSAYAKYDLDNAYLGFNPDPLSIGLNGEKNGWYTKAGYMLPRMPLQFFGRYEQWKYAQLNGIFNQQVKWTGLGANYYIWGQNLKVSMEYSTTKFSKEDTVGGVRTKDFSTFVTALQVLF